MTLNAQRMQKTSAAQQHPDQAAAKTSTGQTTATAPTAAGSKMRSSQKQDANKQVYYKDVVGAATKIQAAYRGHATRQALKRHNRHSAFDEVNRAAAVIQAAWRGHITRGAVEYERALLTHSAVIIQRAYRAFAKRKRRILRYAAILGEAVTDDDMRGTIRDIAQRAVLVPVPVDVKAAAFAAAAFFHGRGVESVTVLFDDRTGSHVLQVGLSLIDDPSNTPPPRPANHITSDSTHNLTCAPQSRSCARFFCL
jgi:hypothetical protein